MYGNSRKVVKKWENEQITKIRPRNKGDDVICVDGKHEAIIDEETFNAARQKRGLTLKSGNLKSFAILLLVFSSAAPADTVCQ